MLLAQAKTRWVLVLLLASLPPLLAVRGGAQDSTLPQVRYPDPDAGVQLAAEAGKKAQAESARQRPRLPSVPVHRPAAGERHHLRAPDRGRRRQDYKAVHYDHGNGVAAADVDGDGLHRPLLHQPARRQRAVEEPRRRQVPEHHRARPASALAGPDQRHRLLRRRRQRRRPGPLRHHRAQGQRPVRERRQGTLQRRHARRPGVDYVGHSSGAVFFDYDSDGRLDLFLVNVGKYTTDEKGPRRLLRRHARRLPGPPASRSARSTASSTATSAATGSRTSPRRRAWRTTAGAATPRSPTSTATACPTSTSSTCRATTTTTRTQGGKRSRQDRRSYFPKTPWGAMGVKFFDYDNDGRRPLRHRHALRHEREVGARATRSSSRAWSWTDGLPAGRGQQRLRQRVLPEPRRGRFEEISDAMGVENYWPWGPERRRPQRRRLGGRLHRRQHELPLPLRHQLAAAEQPRRGVPRQRVPPRRRAAARRPHAHAVVRPGLLGARTRPRQRVQAADGRDHA